jgi:hypothetical protein
MWTSKNYWKRVCDWSYNCKLIKLPKWYCEQLGEISWMIKKKSILCLLKWNCEWPRENQLGWLPKWDCEQLGAKKWTTTEKQCKKEKITIDKMHSNVVAKDHWYHLKKFTYPTTSRICYLSCEKNMSKGHDEEGRSWIRSNWKKESMNNHL